MDRLKDLADTLRVDPEEMRDNRPEKLIPVIKTYLEHVSLKKFALDRKVDPKELANCCEREHVKELILFDGVDPDDVLRYKK